jgi:protein ImuB
MFCCLVNDPAGEPPKGRLELIARASSPRVMPWGDKAVVFDVSGLMRLCGPPEVVAQEVEAQAAASGLIVRVAVATTVTTAWVLAHARAGRTVVAAGQDRAALAPLPLGWLVSVLDLDEARAQRTPSADVSPDVPAAGAGQAAGRSAGSSRRHYRMAPGPAALAPELTARRSRFARGTTVAARQQRQLCRAHLDTLERWGIRTCGDLAALSCADIRTRLGPLGVRLHEAACATADERFVAAEERTVFVDRVELEWPIEGLEPLSFVLARQCERLSLALERADRGAVVIHTTLHLVTRQAHARVLTLPAPMRDPRVLRTLILLDLESHPPDAGIDVVQVRVEVTPGRVVQGSLLARAVPTPEHLSTLLARLGALVGSDRVGSPSIPDTHDERLTALVPFRTGHAEPAGTAIDDEPASTVNVLPVHLRRLRLPLPAQVETTEGRPVRVSLSGRQGGGLVVQGCAGPWRTSGGWWDVQRRESWDRDEWDVALSDGGVYHLIRHRTTGQWEIDGLYD